MILAYPWILLVLLFCAGVMARWIRGQRKRAILYSDERLLASPPRWMIYVWRAGYVALAAALVAAVLAMARPLGETAEVRVYEQMHQGCLVVDISSSMNTLEDPVTQTTRIQVVVDAAKEFVRKRKGDNLCEVPFASGVRMDLMMPLTIDIQALSDALDMLIKHVEGNTAMGDGMFFAFAALLADTLDRNERLDIKKLQKEIAEVKAGRMDGLSYVDDLVRRMGALADTYMVILTDGDYNEGIVDPLALLLVLKRFGIKVYILGVGNGFTANEWLVRLVKQTGGNVLFARDASQTPAFLEAINGLQKRKTLVDVTRKQKEFSPIMMGSAVVCAIFFLCIWMGLRCGNWIPAARVARCAMRGGKT